jgi:hypothetical protein
MIVKRDITGPKAFAYIRNQLDMGKTLSKCLSMLPVEKGKVFSLAPEGALEEQLFNFDSGGIYPFEEKNRKSIAPTKNDSKPLVISEILSHLNSNINSCCFFEDALSLPSDPWVTTSKIEYIHLNNREMLYFFDNNNSNEEKVKKAFSVSESHVLLCALGSLDTAERSKVSPCKEVYPELLKLFVANLSAFFVKAYDGEGYLMWTAAKETASV